MIANRGLCYRLNCVPPTQKIHMLTLSQNMTLLGHEIFMEAILLK